MWAVVLALLLTDPGDPSITGFVRDTTGGAVSGAIVVLQSVKGEEQTITGPDGHFALNEAPEGEATLIIRAGGFAERREAVSGRHEFEIVVTPASLLETVTVTPTRSEQRLNEVPASVNIIDRTDIRQSPAVVADDVLRQVPTFSLFRRTSSLSSHPTSQGVSLRGIGPSGVSRTLVLSDGIPVNDPFGGWVYWTRVPLASVDRIEVVDGSSSSLYGNYAMGGVINIVSARPTPRTLEITPQLGNRGSPKGDVFASHVFHQVGVAFDGSVFDTNGFPVVAPSERGLIDNNATVTYRNLNGRADYKASDRLSLFVRTGYFRENRANGKESTFDGREETNDTTWKYVSGGIRLELPDQSDLQARVFSDWETFDSNFLAVPAPTSANPIPRSVGRMTLNQTVPVKSVGGIVQWSRALGSANFFSAGADAHWVQGDSQEDSLDPVAGLKVTLHRVSGGTQQSAGAFIQNVVTALPRLTITAGARLDHWRDYDAHNLEHNVSSGTPAINNNPALPQQSDTVVSPRIAAVYQLTDRINVWGDVNGGFRTPTLNELYRQFRVGTVLTLANAALVPERLTGSEQGVRVALSRDLSVRSTVFENSIKNPVANVTIATSGVNVTQQRQNVGRTRVWGVQTDVEYRLGAFWRMAGAYVYDRATVTAFAANSSLVGNFLPQVPKHRGSVRLSYADSRYVNVALGLQFVGRQFDDDQNVRFIPAAALLEAGYSVSAEPGLPGFTLIDITASRALTDHLTVFGGAQNLFNTQYFVGTLPSTVGSPRLMNVGVRIKFGRVF